MNEWLKWGSEDVVLLHSYCCLFGACPMTLCDCVCLKVSICSPHLLSPPDPPFSVAPIGMHCHTQPLTIFLSFVFTRAGGNVCHHTSVEVRGHHAGVGSLLPPCRLSESSAGHQTWRQTPFSAGPSCDLQPLYFPLCSAGLPFHMMQLHPASAA